jgi:ABC-2 type transport system ATP-binding protein
MGSKTIIRLEEVSKSFEKQRVLKNISLEIQEGEVFGIVGSSGSGKTTLLEIITGNTIPDQGDVLFEPKQLVHFSETQEETLQSIYKNTGMLKRTVGYSPQDPSFYDNLTCGENISLFGGLHGIPKEIKKINSSIILKLVGLDEWKNKLAKDLSGGMQKRLDLACAIIHDPKIVVLDEPTADLDILLRNQMWGLIRKINRKGTTVIMSSHFLDEIDELCDRIIILNHGKIEFIGSPRELKLKKESKLNIVVETAERNYEHLARKIHIAYKKNVKFRANHELHILLDSNDPVREIQKITEIIKKEKQTLLELTYTKESITDIFRKLQEAPKSPL